MTYDSARDLTVLFGGDRGGYDLETWEWDGVDWTLRFSGGPGPRYQHAMAHDSSRKEVILFGGYNGASDGEMWILGTASADCNLNGIPDECDLADGTSMDADGNNLLDECEGLPAATITAAISRLACDLPLALAPGVGTEPRLGGLSELRLTFDVPPREPGPEAVTLEEKVCPAPGTYGPYTGASTLAANVAGSELVVTFTPGLENLRTYRINIGPDVTSVAGQFVEVRALIGDVTGDGRVNANDRSVVVSAWTSTAAFTCATDLNLDGATNAEDRGIVIGAWTNGQNCAP
jgi:hypothetical protein